MIVVKLGTNSNFEHHIFKIGKSIMLSVMPVVYHVSPPSWHAGESISVRGCQVV